jgi:Helix-turn-helix domain
MDKLADLKRFHERQNIILKNFDPVSAHGFTQVPNFLLKDPHISANAKVVYSTLLSYAWNNDRVFPGQDRMGEDLGLSTPTVSRAIHELEANELLEIERRGQGKTNIYVLKFRVAAKK